MTDKNWFRRTSWTEEDQQDFFAHLQRARRYNRAQYLQIQASCLLATGLPRDAASAIELLDILLRDHPDSVETEGAHGLKARCLEALGRIDEAIDSYRLALAARRTATNIHTYAPLSFGMLVIRNERRDLYEEVLSAFNEMVGPVDLLFPDAQYMYFAASAIILGEAGRMEAARECAAKALRAASMTTTGLARHPDIGLVVKRDKAIDVKLQRLIRPGSLDRIRSKWKEWHRG